MTGKDFEEQFERLVAIYGEPHPKRAAIWQVIFGHLDAAVFAEQVTDVIKEFTPFGQDRWPTPGQFRAIAPEEPKIHYLDTAATAEELRRHRLGLHHSEEQ
jgi:hypothetical protein